MKKLILLSGIITLSITSCKKKNEPKADFLMSKSECYVGDVITITNNSLNAESYLWEADFTQISTTKDLTYTAENDGYEKDVYIGLTIESKKGIIDYTSKILKVKNKNQAFKGYYKSDYTNDCITIDMYLDASEYDNKITFDYEDISLTATPSSITEATISTKSHTYSDGSIIYINGGSILLDGTALTITVNYTYFDYDSGSTFSGSCVSTYKKN
jgi:hypothetical protein